MEARFDVVGVGNALVDILVHADEAFIFDHGMEKGAMTLVDEARADALYALMAPAVEASGGSCANAMAGVASLGGRAAFIGRAADDQLGAVFRHDIRAIGVAFEGKPAPTGSTGRCLIFVTPDAQRTMHTFLGAAADMAPEDVDDDLVASAQITYLEGYLWDQPIAKEGMLKAARAAQAAGRKVALTLSDPFCVERHRDEFRGLIADYVDVLFANEVEALSLYEVDEFDEALRRVRGDCELAAVTRSEKGSVLVRGDEAHVIAAEPVARVVDTTGAGDQYAAGVMFGLARGHDLATCGRIGSIAAGEVISHFGPRPEVRLAELVREKLGL